MHGIKSTNLFWNRDLRGGFATGTRVSRPILISKSERVGRWWRIDVASHHVWRRRAVLVGIGIAPSVTLERGIPAVHRPGVVAAEAGDVAAVVLHHVAAHRRPVAEASKKGE